MAGDAYGTAITASFGYCSGFFLGLLPAAFAVLLFFLIFSQFKNLIGAFLGASVLTGAMSTVIVEILSVAIMANRPVLTLVWAMLVAVPAAVLLRRWLRAGRPSVRLRRPSLTAVEWSALALFLVLTVGELVVSQVYLPNTSDSLSYHLARIEHWRVNESVGPYPEMAYRQVAFAPGGEYLMFTLRVLANSFWATPLVQWACGVGCAAAVYRIAGQLGCGRSGRALAAVLCAAAPGLVLEASGTSNDLVAAFFLLAFASFVLQWQQGASGWRLAIVTGVALGLAILSKSTAVPLAVGFGLWWGWVLLRRRLPGIRLAAVGALATIAIAGPYLAMETAIWGTPTGPHAAESVLLDRHDPVTIVMNTAKILSVEMVNADQAGSRAVCAATFEVHQLAHRDLHDPATEFNGNRYACTFVNEETYASNPWQTALILLAALALLVAGLAIQRTYAIALTGSVLVFTATISYQPWITRLLLGAVLLGCPLVPVAVGRLARRWPSLSGIRAAAGGAIALAVLVGGLAALDTGEPRPFTPGMFLQQRSAQSQLLYGHEDIAAAVSVLKASGARRVGLAGYEDVPEFSLWLLLDAVDDRASIVVTESRVDGFPAPSATSAGVNAVLCVRRLAEPDCSGVVPAGWQTHVYKSGSSVTVLALPPGVR
jgi:hypothetical protein